MLNDQEYKAEWERRVREHLKFYIEDPTPEDIKRAGDTLAGQLIDLKLAFEGLGQALWEHKAVAAVMSAWLLWVLYLVSK